MDLKISKKHSRGARREDVCHCPAARAFKDAGFENVEVEGDFVTFGAEDGAVNSHPLPGTLRKAITDYDDGQSFRLGTYRIAGLRKPKK